MTNLQWCYETNLFATEALAEILDVELPTVEMPDATRVARHVGAGAPRAQPALGAHRRRVHALPAAHHVPPRPPRRAHGRDRRRSRRAPTSTTCTSCSATAPTRGWTARPSSSGSCWPTPTPARHDEQLVQLFHKRNLRAQMLLGPAGSAMARHLPDPDRSGTDRPQRRAGLLSGDVALRAGRRGCRHHPGSAGSRDAIDGPMAQAIEDTINRVEADDSLMVGIITHTGNVFCSGADLKAVRRGEGGIIRTPAAGSRVSRNACAPSRSSPRSKARRSAAGRDRTRMRPHGRVDRRAVRPPGGQPQPAPDRRRRHPAHMGDTHPRPRSSSSSPPRRWMPPRSRARAGESGGRARQGARRGPAVAASIRASTLREVRATRRLVLEATTHNDEGAHPRALGPGVAGDPHERGLPGRPRAFAEKRPPRWQGRSHDSGGRRRPARAVATAARRVRSSLPFGSRSSDSTSTTCFGAL